MERYISPKLSEGTLNLCGVSEDGVVGNMNAMASADETDVSVDAWSVTTVDILEAELNAGVTLMIVLSPTSETEWKLSSEVWCRLSCCCCFCC